MGLEYNSFLICRKTKRKEETEREREKEREIWKLNLIPMNKM